MAKELVFWFWADRTRPDLKAKGCASTMHYDLKSDNTKIAIASSATIFLTGRCNLVSMNKIKTISSLLRMIGSYIQKNIDYPAPAFI